MAARAGKAPAGKTNARARSAALREQQRRQERRRRLLLIGGSGAVVVLVVAALVLVIALKSDKKNAAPSTRASPAVVAAVTGVPAAVWQKVALGSAGLPTKITGPALAKAGKPLIVYIGAEFCPFCAAERWAVISALGRFGTWSNLGATSSASQDEYPNTATFSFHGARFDSAYVAFEGVETTTNQALSGGGWQPLETPTSTQAALQKQYGTDSSGHESIPFIDFANQYRILGASYDPVVLQGSDRDEIAANLTDPNNAATKGILGSANAITAAVCTTTKNQPSNVCGDPTIQKIQEQLATSK
jgi:Domain of unknown function (DUF929)